MRKTRTNKRMPNLHVAAGGQRCTQRVAVLSGACATATGYVRNLLECSDKAEVRALAPYSGVPHVGSRPE